MIPLSPSIPWPRVAAVLGAVVALAAAWLSWTWWSADRALDKQEVPQLADRGPVSDGGGSDDGSGFDGILDVLVVGNDDRSDLSDAERRELHTGSFQGERTDTILWVQLRDDGVSVVSFPRDLLVDDPGGETMRINQVLEAGGPDALVATVERLLVAQLDHYVEVSISSFLDIVDAAGGVELCLEEPLRDRKSGADFDAGCHDMDGADALSYVRSRVGPRGDFARVERQQRFLAALADRAMSLPVLANPARLRNVATSVADGLTVDDRLTVAKMVDLAGSLREVLGDGLDAFTLPAYADEAGGPAYLLPYEPALARLGERLRAGEPLPPRPANGIRDEIVVDIRPAGSAHVATTIESVLYYGGYQPHVRGPAPEGLDPLSTTVYATEAHREEAEAVAAVLGAPLRPFPTGTDGLDPTTITVVTAGESTLTAA